MEAATEKKLTELTHRFYQFRAEEFSMSRNKPWPGSIEAMSRVKPLLPQTPYLLDLGCGNGRLVKGFFQTFPKGYYYGVDFSATLLKLAKCAYPNQDNCEWIKVDLNTNQLITKITRKFELVTLFGVTHHLTPNWLRQLLMQITGILQPKGYLIISSWRVSALTNLTKRQASKKTILNLGLDINQLTRQDLLLPFGKKRNSWRYVHQYNPSDLRNLCLQSNMDIIDQFEADGRTGNLNTYLIAQLFKEK